MENTVKHFTLKLAAAATLSAALSSAAVAGGFMLTEQSVAGLGRAYAGAGIVGDDLSAVWYNPAGMSLLSGTAVQMGAVVADLDLEVTTNESATFGQHKASKENGRKHGVPVPNMYMVHQIKDDMWFGLGITVPFGMATEYDNNWAAADKGMNAEVKVFDINPNVAFNLTDTLSFGAGVSLQYVTAQFEQRQALNVNYPQAGNVRVRLNADGWAWGGNLGFMWQPTETVRIGLAYRSQVNHKADGYLKTDLTTLQTDRTYATTSLKSNDGHAEMSAPHVITLTGTWKATDALRLSGLARWTNWSSFDTLPISGSSMEQLTRKKKIEAEYHWKDSWLFTVGADYDINDEFTVRGGVGYEISPVDDDKYRSATIPDTDRLWLSMGATWHASKNLQSDFGIAYLKGIGNKDLYTGNTKVAEFDKLDAILWGAQFVYKFD
mgnify:CR=1 FL=1